MQHYRVRNREGWTKRKQDNEGITDDKDADLSLTHSSICTTAEAAAAPLGLRIIHAILAATVSNMLVAYSMEVIERIVPHNSETYTVYPNTAELFQKLPPTPSQPVCESHTV